MLISVRFFFLRWTVLRRKILEPCFWCLLHVKCGGFWKFLYRELANGVSSDRERGCCHYFRLSSAEASCYIMTVLATVLYFSYPNQVLAFLSLPYFLYVQILSYWSWCRKPYGEIWIYSDFMTVWNWSNMHPERVLLLSPHVFFSCGFRYLPVVRCRSIFARIFCSSVPLILFFPFLKFPNVFPKKKTLVFLCFFVIFRFWYLSAVWFG